MLGVQFTLSNPRARITTLPKRKFSLPLAVGELCWHLRGEDDVSTLAYYTEAWRAFADDGLKISGSCYGKKLHSGVDRNETHWNRLANLLKNDPATRRATFGFISNDEDILGSKDVSCVSSIQFIIRDQRLSMFTFMRSNDLFLGVPYDVFLLTSLMELMALDIGVEMGEYHHYATSLHLYEKNIPVSKAMLENEDIKPGLSPALSSRTELEELSTVESMIRNGLYKGGYSGPFDDYILALFNFHKTSNRN